MSKGEGEAVGPSSLTATHSHNTLHCHGCPDAQVYQRALQLLQAENDQLRTDNAILQSRVVASTHGIPYQTAKVVQAEVPVPSDGMFILQARTAAFPDMRIYGTDTLGGREEMFAVGARITRMEVGHGVDTQDMQATEAVEMESTNAPEMDPSLEHYVYMAVDTMPECERINVLYQQLKQLQDTYNNKCVGLEQAYKLNHSLQTQLSAANMQIDTLKDKETNQHDQILQLQAQVRQLKPSAPVLNTGTNTSNLRNSIQRGRFMVFPPVLECVNCHSAFDSTQQVELSECRHHMQAPRKLPDKVLEQLQLSGKYRFWPCCQQFSTQTPTSCHGSKHQFNAMGGQA